MKFGIWLTEEYTSEKGGGFSFYNNFIREIDSFKYNEKISIVFIQKQTGLLSGLNKTVITLPEDCSYENSVVFNVSKSINKLGAPGEYLLNKILKKKKAAANLNTVNYLKENKVDILVYPIQGYEAVNDFPFIAINWDIGHLSCYSFPEMTINGEFESRNEWYKSSLHKAILILCESQAGKNELIKYVGIFDKKINIIPAFSGLNRLNYFDEIQHNSILKKHQINSQNYFFYPAQFWAHKNHFGLLKAFQEFLKTNTSSKSFKLVLSGGNKGNFEYIQRMAEKMGIAGNIIFTGFISTEEIMCLYLNAIALVMPTFLGPTNLPLLEAREFNCPVLCSDLEGHREMLGNGAIYFNPEDSASITKAMIEITNPEKRKSILEIAKEEKQNSKFKIETTMIEFEKALLNIIPIRNCWD